MVLLGWLRGWSWWRSGGQRVQLGYVKTSTWKPSDLTFWLSLISSVHWLNCVRFFATPRTAACQASLSITNSWSLLKPMSIELVMPSNHLILCRPFSSCLHSFPASGSFHMSQLFASGGQSIGASAPASVLPVNIQDWSPLGWTGWISLRSKGLSGVYANTTVWRHQFFGAEPSFKGPPLTSICDYWKNHSFD